MSRCNNIATILPENFYHFPRFFLNFLGTSLGKNSLCAYSSIYGQILSKLALKSLYIVDFRLKSIINIQSQVNQIAKKLVSVTA